MTNQLTTLSPQALVLFACAIFSTQTLAKATLPTANQSNDFCLEGSERCTLVVLSEFAHGETGKTIINAARAKKTLTPFSTFKIPNSVIAIETGLISSNQQILSYDANKYPKQAWWPAIWLNKKHNLASAFKYSVVPIYRQLAQEIGQQRMQRYLNEFDYGNKDISSGLDDFWLNGSMKISALGQVNFLQKLYRNQFALAPNSLSLLKEVMLVKKTPTYKLYAKTGTGRVDDKSMLGWYVGFVENNKGVHFFAFNLNRDTYAETKAIRKNILLNHLKKMAIID